MNPFQYELTDRQRTILMAVSSLTRLLAAPPVLNRTQLARLAGIRGKDIGRVLDALARKHCLTVEPAGAAERFAVRPVEDWRVAEILTPGEHARLLATVRTQTAAATAQQRLPLLTEEPTLDECLATLRAESLQPETWNPPPPPENRAPLPVTPTERCADTPRKSGIAETSEVSLHIRKLREAVEAPDFRASTHDHDHDHGVHDYHDHDHGKGSDGGMGKPNGSAFRVPRSELKPDAKPKTPNPKPKTRLENEVMELVDLYLVGLPARFRDAWAKRARENGDLAYYAIEESSRPQVRPENRARYANAVYLNGLKK